MMNRTDHILTQLYSSEDIQKRIEQLSSRIAADFRAEEIDLVGLLNGSYMFLADLTRSLHAKGLGMRIGFLTLSSYGAERRSSGRITLHQDLRLDIRNRKVLLVDDILDSGYTLQFACSYLLERSPAVLKTVVLLDKPSGRRLHMEADYAGFSAPNAFLVGYGLDYGGKYRERPDICILADPSEKG